LTFLESSCISTIPSLSGYYWADTFSCGGVPSTALSGGEDVDGHQIYVGRALFKNDWIPAKVIPGRNVAYVSHGGKEYSVDRFQVIFQISSSFD
jgi:hypothetical protein